MSAIPPYTIILSRETLLNIIKYQKSLSSNEATPGSYLKAQLAAVPNLTTLTTEKFIELLLSTKKPIIFAETSVKYDYWTKRELEILGCISISTPVEIFDNGVWEISDRNFKRHSPPFPGELLFTPGPLLTSTHIHPTPDYEEITTENKIDQDKYNKLITRRLAPVLAYASEKAKNERKKALITIPGIGCGLFAGKFQGQMGEHLNQALQYLIEQKSQFFENISCVYFDPFKECKIESKLIKHIKYKVRPMMKPLLCKPEDYQESGDDFSNCKLFKIVAWDHVSYPGNDFFVLSRHTDDGV